MAWSRESQARHLGLDWSALADRPIDPYLIWADLSDFACASGSRPHTLRGKTLRFRIALELGPGASPKTWPQDARTIASTEDRRRFLTALVEPAELAALLSDPAVLRLELGVATDAAPSSTGANSAVAIEAIKRPVMAVIDDGCAFAHERFRSRTGQSWRARVRYLWDQGRDAQGPWQAPAGQGYGRELSGAAIEALITAAGGGVAFDEEALYRQADYQGAQRVLSHGTHVLDLAAGADPQTSAESPDIIFVQLPRYAVDDTSGASMVTHVMDALAYIAARTAIDQPLVINLSYGSMAGPHDGSTLIESAMDAFLAQRRREQQQHGSRPATHLVLPAGNGFELAGHASWTLDGERSSQTLLWQLPADDRTDSFLEIWYPRSALGRIELCVTPPFGPSVTVPPDTMVALRDSPQSLPSAALIHRGRVVCGPQDAMALLALAPTSLEPGAGRQPAPAGLWRVEVRFAAGREQGAAVPCDAWIERDDPGLGSYAPARQSRFIENAVSPGLNEPSPAGALIRRDGSGNSIAHGALSTVVGACLARPGAPVLSRYSAAGLPLGSPRRLAWGAPRIWPDLVAPGDESEVRPGIRAAGNRSGSTVRMNGSSVAAPQVARRLLERAIQGQDGPLSGLPDLGDPGCPRLGRGRLP